ncbi:cellulose biosynthesis protein BcsO [Klebsiella grimontii]|uniref:cellulose biosynthesis protein BcsO n=1 Tax=Klebsiella TaxID=570 RepID=UPI000D7DEA20|nr:MULTISPECIES: cellulose biosynthesis protein BcsO [Klebsiella]AWT18342.1 cellulose biosynthesis protein BcsO [Klebsiella michiganensis]QLU22582.1 cellulose biosynthesis protein BcsO [Klebsiella oxytoca]EGT0063839.1 cellulose biosynthesis protein BcsO [Klebsiella michiganensis]MBE8891332.1 cellulose biosynthesis protein BcsO [Klebsiella grimontii]MBW5976558.1 cellulose biosynthesis protein BcsO [Klebsiella michiganensis]
MNHYDDLQRFKEKTRTHSLKFKDLSSEAAAGEKGDWVILNQLIPAEEESSLAMGGSVSLPVPQRVPADMFHQVERAVVQTAPAPSAPAPALSIPPSAPQPVPVTDRMAVVPAAPVSRPAAQPIPVPPARPRPAIAPTAEGFAHLFATKTAEPVAKDKDQSLKSLLERIATCR